MTGTIPRMAMALIIVGPQTHRFGEPLHPVRVGAHTADDLIAIRSLVMVAKEVMATWKLVFL